MKVKKDERLTDADISRELAARVERCRQRLMDMAQMADDLIDELENVKTQIELQAESLLVGWTADPSARR